LAYEVCRAGVVPGSIESCGQGTIVVPQFYERACSMKGHVL
jgi:hypothetical protein